MRRIAFVVFIAALLGVPAAYAAPPANIRLSNDLLGGYRSNAALNGGSAAKDAVVAECSQARGRQNEPAVEIDPRNPGVIVGSSNDYCGVYDAVDADGFPSAAGPIWLGYYRSQDGGLSFQSSLVPGYPGDTTPYAARAAIRTASSGDPVLAWDRHGRLFAGSESSEDPAGSAKGFGDQWVATFENPDGGGGATIKDGKEFKRSVVVAKGSSAPGTGGKFHDKPMIQVDRTTSACADTVYYAWSRFTGNNGDVSIYFSRSTDHGATFSKPANLTPNIHDLQYADIAVTGDGTVYVTANQLAAQGGQRYAVLDMRSNDCGRTFTKPRELLNYSGWAPVDIGAPTPSPLGALDEPGDLEADAPAGIAGDCGDFETACASGFTFMRADSQVRAVANQNSTSDQSVYLLFNATRPGSETATGSTYGTVSSGIGSQSVVYAARLNGVTGVVSAPVRVATGSTGHQIFPDIAVDDAGTLHTLWWDSRNDPTYSPALPIGNARDRTTHPALDVYAATSSDKGATWTAAARLTDTTSNPNYEQFSNRLVPFGGDYLWISSSGGRTFGVWTDWRDTVAGEDPRENPGSEPTGEGADVKQCRVQLSTGWSADRCPRAGGLDQNIYGAAAP